MGILQEAFSHLLGEQNELTQEMASRGMSIVYELGDAATKDELVMALVGNLTGTAKKKRAVKVGALEVFVPKCITEILSSGKGCKGSGFRVQELNLLLLLPLLSLISCS